jgi:hypothetical protein
MKSLLLLLQSILQLTSSQRVAKDVVFYFPLQTLEETSSIQHSLLGWFSLFIQAHEAMQSSMFFPYCLKHLQSSSILL